MRAPALLLPALFCACATRTPPPPPPAETIPVTARTEGAAEGQPVEVCILRGGEIAMVPATYRPALGDTVVDGVPWRQAYPAAYPPYAAGAPWYVAHEMMPIPDRPALEKYGTTRVLAPAELKRYGEYRGLPLFVEAGFNGDVVEVVYVFVRPGCEFQPYQQAYTVGAVRGR